MISDVPPSTRSENNPTNHPRLEAEPGLPGWVSPAALLLLVAIGALLRFLYLGSLTFQVDEGYQLLGVRGILEHGVPKLESGFAYTRAPLFLYLEAMCAQVLGLSPFSMRLPAAVFGVLCIPVAWWFGRRLVNPATGWALAALFTFSQWQVEFSRYARFYTLLLLVVMLALIAFHHGYFERKFLGKVAFWCLAVVAITLHDTAVSLGLAFLVLLPWREQTWWRRAGLVVQAGLLGVWWVVYRKGLAAWTYSLSEADFNVVHTTNTAAADATAAADKKPLSFLPDVKLPSLENTLAAWDLNAWYVLIPAAIGLLAAGVMLLAARGQPKRDAVGQVVVGVAMVACAVLHQGALVVMLAVTAAGWWVRSRRDLWSPLGVAMIGAALMLAVHAAVNVKFLSYGYTRGVVWLFRYPDWSRYSLEHLWRGWLLLLVVLPFGLLILTGRARDEQGRPAGPWLIVGWLLLGLCLGGLAEGQFNETRYFFHLSPMIYAAYAVVFVVIGTGIAAALKLKRWGRVAAIALPVALGMGLSEDFRPTTAWSVTQRDYSDERNPVRGVFNWRAFADFHEDVESVSVYVRDQLQPGDRVLSVGPPHRGTLVEYFVGDLDYIVARPLVFTLKRQDEFGRWFEPNNNAEIVDTAERLLEVIDTVAADGGRLWVISNDRMTGTLANLIDPDYAAVIESITPEHATRGRDGSSFAAIAVRPTAEASSVMQTPAVTDGSEATDESAKGKPQEPAVAEPAEPAGRAEVVEAAESATVNDPVPPAAE